YLASAALDEDVDVATAELVNVLTAGGGDIGHGRGHRSVDAQGSARRGRRSPAEADQDSGGAGAHEVQGRGVGGRAADDDGHIEFVDELLEVERFGVRRDVLGRD